MKSEKTLLQETILEQQKQLDQLNAALIQQSSYIKTLEQNLNRFEVNFYKQRNHHNYLKGALAKIKSQLDSTMTITDEPEWEL